MDNNIKYDDRGYMCIDVTKFKHKDNPISVEESFRDVELFEWCDDIVIEHKAKAKKKYEKRESVNSFV